MKVTVIMYCNIQSNLVKLGTLQLQEVMKHLHTIETYNSN